MAENFEDRPLNPPEMPPKAFSLDSFVECKDLPCYKKLTAGLGVNFPLQSDSTKITLGAEARVSVFNTPKGTKVTKGILPALRVTQELGKNAQLMARISPSPSEFARIGVQLKF